MKVKLLINTIDKVKTFIDINSSFNGVITVSSGRYVIDGKSIMGMFSLNLIEPLEVMIEADEEGGEDALLSAYKCNNFVVKS